MLAEAAPAKINLFLHVMARRSDGYHDIESLFAFTDIGDVLRAEEADALSLAISGPFAAGLSPEDNLVMRAARALQQAAGVKHGAALCLEKNLPIASGLGGGSADAAACLRLLTRLWKVEAPLEEIALALGSDVPACLYSRAALATGRGEILQPLPLPPLCLVLVNPGVPVPTKDVFDSLPLEGGGLGWGSAVINTPDPHLTSPLQGEEFIPWLCTARNDLQAPAISLAPQVQAVLEALTRTSGCMLARMSGSGATCFGIFADKASAAHAAAQLSGKSWWVREAVIPAAGN